MKQRITFIIVMLLTMLGSARAANTESIKVLDDYTLTLWEVDALRVLAMDQAITIESGHVIRNGVELFHFDSSYYVTKPTTTPVPTPSRIRLVPAPLTRCESNTPVWGTLPASN